MSQTSTEELMPMACECGCSTAHPRADVVHGSECECGCADPTPEVHNVESLVSLVKDLDRRVRELETAYNRS